MVSFANKQLDFIWHGLHFPDSLPGRQSYLYAFLILTIGYATVRKWRGIRLWHIGVAVVFASALMAVSTMFADEDVTEYYAVIISILFVALYGIMTVLLKLAARKNRELLMVITCGIAIVELAVNMAVTGLDVPAEAATMPMWTICKRHWSWQKRMQLTTMYHFTGLRIQADLLKMMTRDTAMLLEHSFLP